MATLQVSNNVGTGNYTGLTTITWYGEWFTPQASFMLTTLKWRAMKHPSSYSGYVTVKVYKATVGYQPFGDLLASAASCTACPEWMAGLRGWEGALPSRTTLHKTYMRD